MASHRPEPELARACWRVGVGVHGCLLSWWCGGQVMSALEGDAGAGSGERCDVEGEDGGGGGYGEAVAVAAVDEGAPGGGREPVREGRSVEQVCDESFDGEQPDQHGGGGGRLVAQQRADGDAEGAVQGRRHDQAGGHRGGVAVEVDVDVAGVQPRHRDRRRDQQRQHGHGRAGDGVAASLATTTRPRRGVTRKVVVMVPWRYSPAMPRTPRTRATRVITAAGARTWTQAVGAERVVALCAGQRAARPDEPGDDGCGGRPARRLRVVRCFSSSAGRGGSWPAPLAVVSCEEDVLEVGALEAHLVDDDPAGARSPGPPARGWPRRRPGRGRSGRRGRPGRPGRGAPGASGCAPRTVRSAGRSGRQGGVRRPGGPCR